MSRRVSRVADAIQEAVAELVLRELKDPRVGMVTITRVSVSPDLRHARVFFSTLGDDASRRESLAGLRSAAGFMRSRVARRLRLRVAPELNFELDGNPEYAARIARLLEQTSPDESES
jgi:ribosome-binding factor A